MPPESDRPRLTPLTPPSLEERLARVEEVVFEGEDLAHAVQRLGMNASALGDALMTVDKNQQMLTRLGKQLQQVEEQSATKGDLADTSEQHRRELARYRRLVVARAQAASVVVLALFIIAGMAVANYATEQTRRQTMQCEAAKRQTIAVTNYLKVVQANSTNGNIRAAASKVVDALPQQSVFKCGGAQ